MLFILKYGYFPPTTAGRLDPYRTSLTISLIFPIFQPFGFIGYEPNISINRDLTSSSNFNNCFFRISITELSFDKTVVIWFCLFIPHNGISALVRLHNLIYLIIPPKDCFLKVSIYFSKKKYKYGTVNNVLSLLSII